MSRAIIDPSTITLVVDGNTYYLDGDTLMSGPLVAASERDELGSILEHGADEYCEVDFAMLEPEARDTCLRIRAALFVLVRP